MRALLIGLVGAVLAVGGVGAAPGTCKLDGLELVVEASGSDKIPVGARFHVTKASSHFDRVQPPKANDGKPDGHVVVLIEGAAGRWIIDQEYTGFGMPANSGDIWPATDAEIKKINPKQRDYKAEAARMNGHFLIMGGEFEELSFAPANCEKLRD